MGMMNKTLEWNGAKVSSPETIKTMGPSIQHAGWWALHLLELGATAKYDEMIQYLSIAQENGSLTNIREAAEVIIRQRCAPLAKRRPGIARKSGANFKAVKAA